MSSARDITRAVDPPRSVYLDYPLGHTSGRPFEPSLNYEIMVDTLAAFEALTEPGSMAHLRYRWTDTDEWKNKVFTPISAGISSAGSGSAGISSAESDSIKSGATYEDDRVPRYDTPQYQTDLDATHAAELHDGEDCLVCAGIDY